MAKKEPHSKEVLTTLEEMRSALLNMLEDTEETRNTAEANLQRTQLILSNLADGLLMVNKEGRLELFNPAAEQMFDVRARDLLGRTFQELETFPTLTSLIRLMEEHTHVFRKEIVMPRNRVIELTSISLKSGAEDNGTILVSHDITREKQVEQLKSEFVSLAAHQLRTPLSAVKWTLEALLDGDAGPLALSQREFLEKTRTSNERMIALINDLLDVTRIEEGRYLYQPAFSQLEEVIASVVQSYGAEAKRKNITIVFAPPKEKFPRVLIDKEKMLLVIQNLVDNALRYSPEGGMVEVNLSHDKKEVVCSIKDSGIGIPEDQKARLFEKFFRASNAKQVYTEGTGLGLYLSRNIIEAHEGKIWVESRAGEGSTFSFSLPIKQEVEEFLKKF